MLQEEVIAPKAYQQIEAVLFELTSVRLGPALIGCGNRARAGECMASLLLQIHSHTVRALDKARIGPLFNHTRQMIPPGCFEPLDIDELLDDERRAALPRDHFNAMALDDFPNVLTYALRGKVDERFETSEFGLARWKSVYDQLRTSHEVRAMADDVNVSRFVRFIQHNLYAHLRFRGEMERIEAELRVEFARATRARQENGPGQPHSEASPSFPRCKDGEDAPTDTERQRPLSATKRRFLTLCRRRARTGERVAHHLGITYEHARRLAAELLTARLLRKTPRGYRTV